jgi:hypothetical protein
MRQGAWRKERHPEPSAVSKKDAAVCRVDDVEEAQGDLAVKAGGRACA